MTHSKTEPRRVRQPSLGFLSSTAEAAFASDEQNRITVWNRAAADLLGYEPARAIGRRCHEVVRGNDLFGNRFCSESCPLRKMVDRNEAIHAFQIDVPTASGAITRIDCSVVVAPSRHARRHSLVHVLRPVVREGGGIKVGGSLPRSRRRRGDPDPATSSERSTARADVLTRRETQVLGVVATGASTAVIARTLGLSQVTVRNHIQHILLKLEAHSKLQAICIARRFHLI